jgi:hypothetical protein
MVLLMILATAVPMAAQDHFNDLFVGWAPFVSDNFALREYRGWTMSLSGPIGPPTAVLDVTGWYFGFGQSIHSVLGGARYTFPNPRRTLPFVQIVAGPMIWHAGGTAFGLGLVPGGGYDAYFPNRRFGLRVEADYFGMYSPGDYGRHYWGHVW